MVMDQTPYPVAAYMVEGVDGAMERAPGSNEGRPVLMVSFGYVRVGEPET